jgi:2-phospho-L-lactate guanylyltransferase
MRTLAILPIKSFRASKQRLSGLLGRGSRQALAQAMFLDVLAALRRVRGIDAIAVVTADYAAESAARNEGVHLLFDPHEVGQSEAVSIGIRHGLDLGFERVLLVPGDTPLIEPGEVAAMLERAEREATGAVIVPDRHGAGTNALLLSPPDAIAPAFGEGSLERHRSAAAASAGLTYRVEAIPSLTLDVDTPDDLGLLSEALEERRGQACMTRGTLRQLHRSNVRRSVARRPAGGPAVQVQA